MITDLIVISSVVLAAAYALAWWVRPDVRERIEQPKHGFQERVQQYDQRVHSSGDEG